MKIHTAIIALTAVLFIAPVFTDHNRTDEQGWKQGHWTEFPGDGLLAAEGEYVDDKKHGQWVLQYDSGAESKGPFMSGKKHGHWVFRGDSYTAEGQYVNGKKHGHWVEWSNSSGVEEGQYVNGKKRGHWVEWWGEGSHVNEGHYVDGKRHGRWVIRFDYPNGYVGKGPYVGGKKHGLWIERSANGEERKVNYRNGEEVK